MKKILFSILFLLGTTSIFAQDAMPLVVGSAAPDFEAKDQNGKTVSLQSLTKKGSVVVIFYRGQWCPYCNKQLSALEDSLGLITAKNATVIAVTPETEDNVEKTISKTKVSYSVLNDKGLKIMKAYKVAFDVDAETVKKYKGYGIDFDKANGDNGAVLPVPAVYIINKKGKITYAFFDKDYRKRASVQEIANNL